MKQQIRILLILACLAALAGCGGNGAASSSASPSAQESVNEPAPETSAEASASGPLAGEDDESEPAPESSAAVPEFKTYRMDVPEEEDSWAPELLLQPEEQQFRFTYDLLSAWSNSGTYQIEEDLLIATVNPLAQVDTQFVFRIVDSKTLAFVEDQSSPLRPLHDERFAVPVYDGALFILKEEEAAPDETDGS